MAQINPEKFDDFLRLIEEIKTQMTNDKKSARKREKSQVYTQWVTVSIAVMSLGLSVWTVFFNINTDSRNFQFQRDTQAYTLWFGYLQSAAKHPDMANGFKLIDHIPVQDLACRVPKEKMYPDSSVEKFQRYAWFVADALGHAEIVGDLVAKGDTGWTATIDTLIANHIEYVSSDCFTREQYGNFIKGEINKISRSQKRRP